ncbi:hypothetical protein GYMLUDRAFT_46979 [Collybiopsis luxurians FD-317 M1]|uniref:Uncharacterized protein n=1 Tax=Collybiopsis luxurians FD-317 M1 TaxID=944289 RepID=A0A0D0CN37_9AGAR|nr:hypothetical protein GYMLUDRAFT_46979 [Collybiopsis luxurians FD-317 M1]
MSPTVTGVSGTQSPPLEATGEDKPMGASSVESAQRGDTVEAVPDKEQRKQYFEPVEQENSNSKQRTAPKGHAMGQSLADTLEKQT